MKPVKRPPLKLSQEMAKFLEDHGCWLAMSVSVVHVSGHGMNGMTASCGSSTAYGRARAGDDLCRECLSIAGIGYEIRMESGHQVAYPTGQIVARMDRRRNDDDPNQALRDRARLQAEEARKKYQQKCK